MVRFVIAVILLISAQTAYGATFDAVDKACREDDAICLIYFSALAEGLAVLTPYANAARIRPPFCLPKRVNVRDMGDVIKNYVYAHPEHRHHGMATMGLLALIDAYPCPSP